jgi:hypothetical protein
MMQPAMKLKLLFLLILGLQVQLLCSQDDGFDLGKYTTFTSSSSMGGTSIEFYRDGTFDFHEWCSCTSTSILGTGVYSRAGNKITLHYKQYPINHNREQKYTIEELRADASKDSFEVWIEIADTSLNRHHEKYSTLYVRGSQAFLAARNITDFTTSTFRFKVPKLTQIQSIELLTLGFGYSFRINAPITGATKIIINQLKYHTGRSYLEPGTMMDLILQNRWTPHPRLYSLDRRIMFYPIEQLHNPSELKHSVYTRCFLND